MKKKSKFFLLALSALVGLMFGTQNVFAATLQMDFTGYWYERSDNGSNYSSWKLENYYVDGNVAFCIEPGIPEGTNQYVQSSYNDWNISNSIKQKVLQIAYYGYQYPGHQTQEYRAATQALIWETILGGNTKVTYSTERYGAGSVYNVSAQKSAIMDLVNHHYDRPSFNGTTVSSQVGTPITLTDTNNVLSNYEVYASNGAEVSINGNQLTITPTEIGDIKLTFVRKQVYSRTYLIYLADGYQNMLSGGNIDPLYFNINVKGLGPKVEINKVDSKTLTTTPSGEASLKNAKFGIYDMADNLIQTLTTDENGYAISDYLPSFDLMYLKEISASNGYQVSEERFYFQPSKNEMLSYVKVLEDVITRDYEITKVVASDKTGLMTPEVNVGFEIYNNKNEVVFSDKTDNDGKLYFTLPYGHYRLHQSTQNTGFEKIEDWNFEIKDLGPTINKVFSNAEITARLKVIKIDDSGNNITKSGIKFKIKDLSTGKYVCQSVSYPKVATYCEFETSDDGTLITPYPLNSGDYELEEIDQVIYGYLWNSEPLKFSINEKSDLQKSDEFDTILEVKFENKEVKGMIEIKKTGEKLVIGNDTYTYEEIKLPNVVFEVYDENNNLIGTIKTDESGYGKLENLKLQKYILKEVSSALDNMLDENEYEFELVYKDQYTPIITKTFTLKNYLPKGTLEFSKTDLSTSEPIPNTLIEIYVADTDELIFSDRTDDKGMIVITDLPTNIDLYILEKETANPSYILNEEKMYFSISENGEVVKANMENEKKKGTLEFSKIDLSTSAPIPNTLIEIYNADTDELVFSGRTDEQGMIVIELEYGKYYILEKETADTSYKLNEEKMYFEILENGEVIKATMTNEKIEMPKTFNTDLSSTIIIAITALLGIGLLVYEKKKNK